MCLQMLVLNWLVNKLKAFFSITAIINTMKLTLKRGLFLGLLIGVASALLYAPKTGKELREELKEKVEAVPQNFFNLLESLIDLTVSVLDFAKAAFKEQSFRFSKAFESGLSAAKEKSDELKRYATQAGKSE